MGQSELPVSLLEAATSSLCSEHCSCFSRSPISSLLLWALSYPRLPLLLAFSWRPVLGPGASSPSPTQSWKYLGAPFANDEGAG